MKYAWIEDTPGNGPVVGLNRSAGEGELEGTCNWQVDGIYGMDTSRYKVVNDVFTPISQSELDEVLREEAEANALSRLAECYESKKADGGFEYPEKPTKISKALRKETKGTATPDDIKMLDDNDIIDDWYDTLETEMEAGEAWIEDPIRTTVELNAFDPYINIDWTAPPVL